MKLQDLEFTNDEVEFIQDISDQEVYEIRQPQFCDKLNKYHENLNEETTTLELLQLKELMSFFLHDDDENYAIIISIKQKIEAGLRQVHSETGKFGKILCVDLSDLSILAGVTKENEEANNPGLIYYVTTNHKSSVDLIYKKRQLLKIYKEDYLSMLEKIYSYKKDNTQENSVQNTGIENITLFCEKEKAMNGLPVYKVLGFDVIVISDEDVIIRRDRGFHY